MSVAESAGEEGGVFVVQRLVDGFSWDGAKWVAGWGGAILYPPAPDDGPTRARVERDRLRAAGESCGVFYISSRARRTSRSLPLPTLALGA